MMRKDWLDELGLKAPATWYNLVQYPSLKPVEPVKYTMLQDTVNVNANVIGYITTANKYQKETIACAEFPTNENCLLTPILNDYKV